MTSVPQPSSSVRLFRLAAPVIGINVLNVLGLLVELEPAQSQLLEAICEGPTLDFRGSE